MPDSFTAPWTVTCQAPVSMGFPRQEYWSGWPFPSPGDLPNPGIEPCLLIVWLNLELCPHLPGFWRPCLLFFIIYFFPLQLYWGAVLSRFSYVWLFATLWTLVCQAPMSMRFSRQEYWTGLLFPPPGDLPDPGIEPTSPAGGFFTTKPQGNPSVIEV